MDAVERVRDALERGELGTADLTARRLGAWLGKTTSVLYHHWGSLDGFLHAVSESGMIQLGLHLTNAASLEEIAEGYLGFALDRPALYELMFHHPFDYAALRCATKGTATPGLQLWRSLVERLAAQGSNDPDADARALYAGLHGLASLAISGRANIDNLTVTDREAAMRAARRLVHLIRENAC